VLAGFSVMIAIELTGESFLFTKMSWSAVAVAIAAAAVVVGKMRNTKGLCSG